MLDRADHLLAAVVGDRIVVLDRSTATCHVLNPSAALILDLVDGTTTVNGLIDELHAVTNAGVAVLEPDVRLTIDRFRRDQLVRTQTDDELPRAPAASTFPPRDEPAAGARGRWRPAVARARQRAIGGGTGLQTVGSVTVAGTSLAIHVSDADVGRALDEATRCLPRTTQAATQVWVLGGTGARPWRVYVDDELLAREADATGAIDLVLAELNRIALTDSGPGVLLHAGAVERDGRVVVVAGLSGRGKSTLTAALVAAGFGYLTDELVVVEPASHAVTPFPKALDLSPASQELLGLDPLDDTRSGKGRVSPDALGRISTGGRLALLVLLTEPSEQGTPPTETSLERLDPVDAVLGLLPNTFAETFADATDLDDIAGLCTAVPVVRLDRTDLDRAVALVRDAFDETA